MRPTCLRSTTGMLLSVTVRQMTGEAQLTVGGFQPGLKPSVFRVKAGMVLVNMARKGLPSILTKVAVAAEHGTLPKTPFYVVGRGGAR